MKRVLVCHDGSEEASSGVLEYVGSLGEPAQITLFHVLEQVPPGLLEHQGSEDPKAEEALERGGKEKQRQWIEERTAKVDPILRAVAGRLQEVSPHAKGPELKIVPSYEMNDFLPLLHEEVSSQPYDEMVILHHAHSWWKRVLHRTESDLVPKKFHDLPVRVVECPSSAD